MAASQSRSRKSFDGPTAEEKIVASLIELMEAGSAPWRRPWDGSGGGHHVNLISGHRYRGANPILLTLGMHIRSSALPFWCGFAEAKKLGIFPRKGSKAVHILRPQLHSREEPGEVGDVTLRSWASYRPVAVFNAADLEGPSLAGLVEARKIAEGVEPKPEPQRLEAAEAVLGAWPVPVIFGGIGPAICPPSIGSSCPIAPASTHQRHSAPPGPMSRSTPLAMSPASSGIWAVLSGSRAMPVRSWSPN
jgi:antirestriction protein ArdC